MTSIISVEQVFSLPVAPEAAFAYVGDPSNDQEWQSSCVGSHLLDAELGSGCRYAIHFCFLGRRMNFVGEVTTFEPATRFGYRVHEGPFHYDGAYQLEAEAAGTRVHWQFNAAPGPFFGLLPASLLRKVLLSQVQRDSMKLASILGERFAPSAAA
jgi:Polyketide cyclase / dehydrase and lipid transport